MPRRCASSSAASLPSTTSTSRSPADRSSASSDPNGAGKTTFFNMITGLYKPTSGRIMFDGNEITGRKPHQIVRAGIGRTFQNIRLFGNMTRPRQRARRDSTTRSRGRWWQAILRPPSILREEERAVERARELLDLLGPAARASTPTPATCPTATSAASRSPGRWRPAAEAPPPRRADGGHEPRGEAPLHGLRAHLRSPVGDRPSC